MIFIPFVIPPLPMAFFFFAAVNPFKIYACNSSVRPPYSAVRHRNPLRHAYSSLRELKNGALTLVKKRLDV
ncbi:hypothetical protein DDT56_20880 [Brenneria corticis]|uniref:Uncharacterized protein n=1 Tax=Brenneria corticis TaxID=2173106 RepID=A0A2U1TNI6_9GAMM|nr:hypothetical protein DDT56_20880 [Brenneria sp. CFCC 11842]